MRAFAYIRVSSRGQDLQTQRVAIERAATARGDEIAHWYEEKVTGSTIDRPALTELRSEIRAGGAQKLYVFRIDRLLRTGIRDAFNLVEEFRAHGCTVATIADSFSLDGPGADIVLAVMAWGAQMELAALGERISAARSRIEAAGGRWGRPRRVDPGTLARARELVDEGRSIRAISIALKVPKSTIADALSEKGHYARATKPFVQKCR